MTVSRRSARAAMAAVVGLLTLVLLPAGAASAHPLGNFTVNTHVGLRLEPEAVAARIVVDSAEIPTVQAFPDGPPAEDSPESKRYRDTQCSSLADELAITVDDRRVTLDVTSTSLTFPPGSAGLVTTRLTCDTRASVDTVGTTVLVEGTPAGGRVGWHELVAVGDGVTLAASDVPTESISDVLRSYPQDLLSSPVDQSTAVIDVTVGSGVVAGDGASVAARTAEAAPLDPLTERFTQLVGSPELTVAVAVLAFLGAIVLGALHAFAPGHGKALMAAYLVGQDGSWRQASLIGLSVTVTHTAGVLVLGVILSTVAVTAPERVYPYLGLASGLLVCGIGTTLVRRALARRRAVAGAADEPHPHDHDHDHPHGHGHGPGHDQGHEHPHDAQQTHEHRVTTMVDQREVVHSHGTGPAHSHAVATDARGLLAVGFAGGLVPAPSAVVVLLGGIALGRAWFGVLLVLAYGIGMACALAGTGLLLVHARRRVQAWVLKPGSGRGAGRAWLALLPLAAAGFVVVVGVGLTLRAVSQIV